jgi:hypothetical protein
LRNDWRLKKKKTVAVAATPSRKPPKVRGMRHNSSAHVGSISRNGTADEGRTSH